MPKEENPAKSEGLAPESSGPDILFDGATALEKLPKEESEPLPGV